MKSCELRISAEDLDELQKLLRVDPDRESAAFLLAGRATLADRIILLVRRVIAVPEADYRVRTRSRIELSTRAINGLAALCESNRLGAVLCHSHPDEVPYSPSDDHGESRIATLLASIVAGQPTGSLLLTPAGFHGRAWLPSQHPAAVPLARLRVIGRCLRDEPLIGNPPSRMTIASEAIADRNILALGKAGQALIEATRVGIVGVGGTGSPLAEQLVRLGVRDLVLVDKDRTFEPSNLSRVYGSRYSDAYPPWWRWTGRGNSNPKVEIVAAHLLRINPTLKVSVYPEAVTRGGIARALLDRDLIFACTDDHWGRAVLNQIGYQYLIPVINLGIGLDGVDGKLTGGIGVVQVLRPGLGCLWCCGFLDAARIRAESLPEAERVRLQAEGYVRGLGEPAPSVVTLTTTTAGLAGNLFIQLVTDFMGEGGDISRLSFLPLEGTCSRGRVAVRASCVCAQKKGKGDLIPLPLV